MKQRIKVGSKIKIPNIYITDTVSNIVVLTHNGKVEVEIETRKGYYVHPEQIQLIEVINEY